MWGTKTIAFAVWAFLSSLVQSSGIIWIIVFGIQNVLRVHFSFYVSNIYIYIGRYPFLNLYSDIWVKPCKISNKYWKLLISFFFWLCETALRLVAKSKIKCYCSYYVLGSSIPTITHRFSSFGMILCLFS